MKLGYGTDKLTKDKITQEINITKVTSILFIITILVIYLIFIVLLM